MTTRLGLDVEVSRCAVDEEEAGNLASRMILFIPGVDVLMTGGGESAGVFFMFFGADRSIGSNFILGTTQIMDQFNRR